MNKPKSHSATGQGPSGLTPRSGGRSSQFASQQGWGTNEAERTETPKQKQDSDGGMDYDYGARDFGDTPLRVSPPNTSKEMSKDRSKPKAAPTPRGEAAKPDAGKPPAKTRKKVA